MKLTQGILATDVAVVADGFFVVLYATIALPSLPYSEDHDGDPPIASAGDAFSGGCRLAAGIPARCFRT